MKKGVRENIVYIHLGIITILLVAECYCSHAVRFIAAKPVKVVFEDHARSRGNDVNMQFPVLHKMQEKSKSGGTVANDNAHKSPSGPSPIGNWH